MGEKISVLIIDDDDDHCEVVCELLKMKGLEILGTGKNGKQAFELYKKLRPDIVIMDVNMPEYDGFYGLNTILDSFPLAKVAMLTASIDGPTSIKSIEFGACAVFFKPFDIEVVIKKIKSVMNVKDLEAVQ